MSGPGVYDVKNVRLHWDAVDGWLLDVPVVLPSIPQPAIDWMVKQQIERWRGLPPGEKKDQLAGAIKDLQAGKIRQLLKDHDGDGYSHPFASTERTTTTAYSFPEVNKNG